jgi:hypothetical protein
VNRRRTGGTGFPWREALLPEQVWKSLSRDLLEAHAFATARVPD